MKSNFKNLLCLMFSLLFFSIIFATIILSQCANRIELWVTEPDGSSSKVKECSISCSGSCTKSYYECPPEGTYRGRAISYYSGTELSRDPSSGWRFLYTCDVECISDNDCKPYEKCDCPDAGCSRQVNNDYTCYDFRSDITGTCKYYDYCENGYEPGNPGILCDYDDGGYGEHCSNVEKTFCDDSGYAAHVWFSC